MTKHRAPKPPRRAAAPRAPWFTLHAPTLLSDAETRLDTRLAWVFAALLAIALFLVATGPHVVGDAFTETDFYGAYAEGARLLQQGQIDPTRYRVVGPGYEAALALFGLPFRDLLLAAEMLSLVSMVAGWLLWVVLLKRRTDARLALIAGAFIALNPTFFRYGYSATTDALAFALQALALFLLLARSGLASAALAGVVAALAFLTRYNAVYLLPAGLVALWLGGTLQERRGRAALLFAAGFVAPVVPWVLFSLARGGALGLELHHNIAYDVFARSRKIPWDEYQEKMQPQFKTLWDVIAKDPAAVIKRELFNVWDHLRLDAEKLLRWPVAAAALIGIGFAWVDGTLRRTWPVVLAGALLFLTLVPVFHSERYSLPLVPIYALLAAATFASRRWALAIGRSRRLWLKAVVAVVVLALSLFASVRYQVRSLQPLPIEVLEVSRTLRALKGPSDRLLARKPHIAFHGQIKMVPFPFTKNLPDLGRYVHQSNVRWLYFSWLEAELRPEYMYLLDTTGAIPGLTIRHATRRYPAVLYEIGPEFGREPDWFRNDTLVAVHNLRARLLINARDAQSLVQLASIEAARGDYAQTERLLERAVRVRPGQVDLWLWLGDARLRLRKPTAADEAFVRAQLIEPQNATAQIGRGWASRNADRPQDAAALWRPVIEHARDPVTLTEMIDLYRRLGDREAEALARQTLDRLGAP